MKRFLCFVTFLLILASCGPRERNATGVQGAPEIWPDYVGVTVPATIAPLDFTLPGDLAPRQREKRHPVFREGLESLAEAQCGRIPYRDRQRAL